MFQSAVAFLYSVKFVNIVNLSLMSLHMTCMTYFVDSNPVIEPPLCAKYVYDTVPLQSFVFA